MIMARNEDGTYSQVGFVKDNAGIDTEYIYDKDGDIVFEKGFTRETSGTVPLTINGIGKDLKAWSIAGNTVQNGSPTPDNPVEGQAVGDRTANLFDKNTITVGNFATVSGTVANKSYYCSDFIPITATTYYFQNAVGSSYQNTVVVYDANKQGLRYEKLSGGNKASGAIAFQSGDAYIRINCYYQTDVDTVMVNIGSTALPYEPYGYKIPVVTRGKNLAGNYTVSSGYYYDDSGTPTPSDARFIRLIINVEPNTIYTISSNLKFYSIWEFNNNTKISRHGGNNSNKYTIKTTKECNSLRISMINTSGEADTSAFEWIQLEEGTTATPYEPYHEPITTPIYLPTPLYSGEVMRSDGSREVKWGKIVLTGEEKIVAAGATGTSYRYDFTNIKTISQIKYARKNSKITHFKQCDMPTIDVVGYDWHGASFHLMIMTTQSTINKFKDWLKSQYEAGTPVTVWYQLATPTTETFTAPQIPTLNGTTVIDVDTAVKSTEMYTKYKSSK